MKKGHAHVSSSHVNVTKPVKLSSWASVPDSKTAIEIACFRPFLLSTVRNIDQALRWVLSAIGIRRNWPRLNFPREYDTLACGN